MPWLDNIRMKHIEGRKIDALSRVVHAVPGGSDLDEGRGEVRGGDLAKARGFGNREGGSSTARWGRWPERE